jgi:hypothetical protein
MATFEIIKIAWLYYRSELLAPYGTFLADLLIE